MRKKKSGHQIFTVLSLCVVVLLMGSFFAAQSYSVALDGINIKKAEQNSTWSVELDADSYKETSIPTIDHKVLANTVINTIRLSNPGEATEYSFEISNKGNMDAALKSLVVDGINNDHLAVTIRFNGKEYNHEEEYVLEAEKTGIVSVKVEYKALGEEEYYEPIEAQLYTTFEFTNK